MARRFQLPTPFTGPAAIRTAAFLADPGATPAARPTRRQAVVLLSVLVVAAAGAALVSWLLKPSRAQAFDLFRGSLYINDSSAPVSVDLASGKPTVRLRHANLQVGATDANALTVYPLQGGTLLLNHDTGEFNMVDGTGFVIKLDGGVPLPARRAATSARGVPAGSMAYVVRSGGRSTDVYLVGQATVQAASAPKAHVDPRAYRTLPGDLAAGDGALAAANGDLWALTGTGVAHRLWHLVLPPGSDNGTKLSVAGARTVQGPAAVGVATTHIDGTGGDVVAVATSDHIDLTTPVGRRTRVTFRRMDGVDTLVPATNQHGRVAFLAHAADGWNVLSVRVDGTHLEGPRSLQGIGPQSPLAQPAASLGALYTMDRSTGEIVRLGYDGRTTHVATYPLATVATTHGLRTIEPASFGDGYLVARGARVIVDSPFHDFALTLFTDGSSAPVRIIKSAAADVNAAGAVDALTGNRGAPPSGKAPAKAGKAPTQPAQPVNTTLDCTKTSQVPHVPLVTAVDPGSRSVHLEWTYPTLDPQDCVPSTYTLKVELVSANAPSPPGLVTVQGQKAVNLVGLFPSTQYRITLTAYINGRGTSAQPVLVTTGPEGPAAPTGVTANSTASGDWTVSWRSCGGVQQGCVPAASWDVLPSFCDGVGLSGPLQPVNLIGDPTLHTFTATYHGGGALLGRALSFIVQGRGEQDTKGTPSKPSGCVQSWSAPIASALTLLPPATTETTVGGASTVTVTINLGADAQRNVGGLGASVTFQLSGPNGTRTNGPVTFDGRSSVLTSTFAGVQTGEGYTAAVIVSPPAHPSAAVTVGPEPVTPHASWPLMSIVNASCPASSAISISCDFSANLRGLASSDVNGERFDLVSPDSKVVCGSFGASLQAQPSPFDPSSVTLTAAGIPLVGNDRTCTVDVWLVEDGSSPTFVFAKKSPLISTTFSLGAEPTLAATQRDFTASWDSQDGPVISVRYVGDATDDQLDQLTQSWTETVTAGPGGNVTCATSTQRVHREPIYVRPSTDCLDKYGNAADWNMNIQYTNADGSPGNDKGFDYQPAGTPPGQCAPTTFNAMWDASGKPVVDVSYGGSANTIAGCSGWQYTLQDDKGNACGTPDTGADPSKTTAIAVSCSSTPDTKWTVAISYLDTSGTRHSINPDVPVTGTPP